MNKIEQKSIVKARHLEYIGYRNKSIRNWRRKQEATGWAFMIMPIVVMTIFVFGALIVGLMFLSKKGRLSADFSAIKDSTIADNFRKLSLDPLFSKAIKNTFIFTGILLASTITMGLIMASLLNVGKGVKGKKLFLMAFFFPQLVSGVAATMVFVALFKNILTLGGKPSNYFYVAVISAVWVQLSSTLINFNVAFTNIGKTEYEAASIDGANAFVKFFRITIPLLAPIIAYQLITTIAVGMTAFGQVFILISNQYVSPEPVILWAVLGYIRVIGNVSGFVSNVGLGMMELLLLGVVVFTLVLISNKIQPMGGTK